MLNEASNLDVNSQPFDSHLSTADKVWSSHNFQLWYLGELLHFTPANFATLVFI